MLNWKLRPDIEGCGRIQIGNESDHHEHVIHAELLAADGRPLWDSGAPDYVLAGSQRALTPPVCAPASSPGLQLRLITENRTITLPAPGAMLAESKPE